MVKKHIGPQISIFLLAVLITGCSWWRTPAPITPPTHPPELTISLTDVKNSLASSRVSIDTKLGAIDKSAEHVGDTADKGAIKAPELEEWNTILDRVVEIRTEAQAARTELEALIPVGQSLLEADAEIHTLTKYAETYEDQIQDLSVQLEEKSITIEDYEKGTLRQQKAIWVGVTALSAVGIVIGIALSIWASPKLGVPLVAACATLTCVSYFMVKYAMLVAATGGILLVITIIAVIYIIATNKKALIESVLSFQLIKDKNFSDPVVKQNIKQIQSNSTRKLVNQIKVDNQI